MSDKSSNYYKSAIEKLNSCAISENPINTVLETLKTEKWIPLVAKLYEWCEKQEGKISGKNPNFFNRKGLLSCTKFKEKINSNGLNLLLMNLFFYIINLIYLLKLQVSKIRFFIFPN